MMLLFVVPWTTITLCASATGAVFVVAAGSAMLMFTPGATVPSVTVTAPARVPTASVGSSTPFPLLSRKAFTKYWPGRRPRLSGAGSAKP